MRAVTILSGFIILLKALLPAMDTAELAKLPLLINHFQEHRRLDRSMTFADFLALHYADARHHEEDHSTHSQLPFGQHHHLNVIISVWHAPTLPGFPVPPQPLTIKQRTSTFHRELPAHTSPVWQPPRFV